MGRLWTTLVLGWFFSLTKGQVCSRSVCLPEDYNQMDLPEAEDGGPVRIMTTIHLIDIFNVHSDTFTLDLSLYINFGWIDNRILRKISTAVEVPRSFMELVWKPDLYIWDLNQEHKYSNKLTRETMFIQEYDNTTYVSYSTEIDVGVVWPMNFSRFPFDSNACEFRLSSFIYENEKVLTFYTNESTAPDTRLKKEKINKYHIEVDYLNDSRITSRNYPESFDSAPGLRIVLTTKPEKYLWVYFLPSSMFTFTSWNSWKLKIFNILIFCC